MKKNVEDDYKFPCDSCIVFPCCASRAKGLDSFVEVLRECPKLQEILHRFNDSDKLRKMIPTIRNKFNLSDVRGPYER